MSWRCAGALVMFAALLGPTPRAGAGELSVFFSSASPGEEWRRGWGGTLGTTWFRVINLEAELARQPLELSDGGLTSFTTSALLAPRIGALKPYCGVGVGLYRESVGARSQNGALGVAAAGLKFEVGLLVLKGEYRRFDLSGTPRVGLDSRVSLGVGLVF